MVHARTRARCLPFDDINLHVLDLNPDEQEIDFPHNDIFQMVPDEAHVKLFADFIWNNNSSWGGGGEV